MSDRGPGVPVFLTNDPEERFCPMCSLELPFRALVCWRCGWEAWQRIEAARERELEKSTG